MHKVRQIAPFSKCPELLFMGKGHLSILLRLSRMKLTLLSLLVILGGGSCNPLTSSCDIGL